MKTLLRTTLKLNSEVSNLEGSISNFENLNREITDQDTICTYYINTNNVRNSPRVKVLIQDQVCHAVIDTGCQNSISEELCTKLPEELYTKLKYVGVDSLELPTPKYRTTERVFGEEHQS
jgi:hypothetical protein